jgi:hypothetical protein
MSASPAATRSSRLNIVADSHQALAGSTAGSPSTKSAPKPRSECPRTPRPRGGVRGCRTETCISPDAWSGRGAPQSPRAVVWLKTCPLDMTSSYAVHNSTSDDRSSSTALMPWKGCCTSAALMRRGESPRSGASLLRNGTRRATSGIGARRGIHRSLRVCKCDGANHSQATCGAESSRVTPLATISHHAPRSAQHSTQTVARRGPLAGLRWRARCARRSGGPRARPCRRRLLDPR